MMNNFYKTPLALGVALVWGAISLEAIAATPVSGDILTITGTTTTSGAWVTGSYFGMDTNGNAKIADSEKVAVSQGTAGLVIGVTTSAGASHSGAPAIPPDTNAIDDPWNFFGNTGSHYLTVAATGSTTAGLDFSGWTVTWNAIPAINMGTGATWIAGYTNGVANFTWDGVYGHTYTLNYAATVPAGDPSGFSNVKYFLHLEGVVTAGAADSTPPTVQSTTPATTGTLSVSAGGAGSYSVTFSEAMKMTPSATVTSGSISIAGVTVGTPTTSDNTTYSFPLTGMANSTTYTVVFNAGPLDVAGNALTLPANKTFTTNAETTPPTLDTKTPAASATDVATNTTVQMVFSEAMNAGTVASAFTLTSASGTVAGTMATSAGGTTFTFSPSGTLAFSTVYTATLSTAATDAAGNAIATVQTWTFTTAVDPSADTSTVIIGVPASGGAGGGCAMNPSGRFDLSLILAALGGLGYAAWKRKRG